MIDNRTTQGRRKRMGRQEAKGTTIIGTTTIARNELPRTGYTEQQTTIQIATVTARGRYFNARAEKELAKNHINVAFQEKQSGVQLSPPTAVLPVVNNKHHHNT
jgi:hypothetical protein